MYSFDNVLMPEIEAGKVTGALFTNGEADAVKDLKDGSSKMKGYASREGMSPPR
jgi:hypothetical protein